ncbi:MAG TPA: FAD-dependent oxidoreductase, partial [Blastocatellia bacterium]|nr:FAD-dependent oxidoreductase [Blastocatellia bacterium]
GYGSDEIYTRMSMHSLGIWKELFQQTGERLFHPTGVLWMSREGDPYGAATGITLQRAGVRMEMLSESEIANRYPQMSISGQQTYAILEPDSGVLMSRRAVTAVIRDACRMGLKYEMECALEPVGRGQLTSVQTASGRKIRAGQFIFACGPWLPKLFPTLLGNRIFPTRQEVFFFAPPAGDSGFATPSLPVWLDFTDPRGPYGFPDLENRGFKLAFDHHGPRFDPDTGDRRLAPGSLEEARKFLSERFPALANAPLTESRVCQYENTSNGDFLIDQHPDFENVWLVGGGSGHGFKHGPAVGEYAVNRILHQAAGEPRFSLATKGEIENRTVY